ANVECRTTRSHGVINAQSSNHNGTNGTKKSGGKSASSSSAVVCFFKTYCPPTSADAGSILNNSRVRHVLGQKYHEDITTVCSQTPYCLYFYTGVDLGEEKNGNVIMVGFFDKATGENQIILLDVFSSEETADAICSCVVEILKKYKIPLTNMAIVYSDFPRHEDLLSGLKAFKPEIVSLCGLANLGGQVCHSGVMEMELSGLILNFITDVYKHFPTFPVSLKEMLIDVDLNRTLTSQCSLFWRIIDRITTAWSDLEKHFGQNTTSDVKTILSDAKLRLSILFLCHALQPLYNFQEKIHQGASVTHLLQDASRLLTFYTSSFLRSEAAESFLRRGKISLLKDTAGHLPRGEVQVGKAAADFLLQNSEELTDYLESFHKTVISFYTTVTLRIVECLPLPDSTLKNLSLVLSPGRKLEVTSRIVQELGARFGVCSSPETVSLLTDEFLEYQFIDESDVRIDEQSMEQYWKRELRIMGRTSFWGKLIVSLLALPGTLKKEIVFEQLFHHTEEKNMADDDVTDSSSYKSAPSHISPENVDSITSGVADLMEVEDSVSISSKSDSESRMDTQGNCDDDDVTDDDCSSSGDDVCLSNRRKRKRHFKEMHTKQERGNTHQGNYAVGEMVWGPIEGFGLWPGLVQSLDSEKPCDSMRKVMFFGNRMVLESSEGDLLPFFSFAQCFCSNSFATVTTYKDAIFSSLQVASKRSRMFFSPDTDCKEELIRVMLNWAFGGFKPSGVKGLRPPSGYNEIMPQPVNRKASAPNRSTRPEKLFSLTVSLNKLAESLDLSKGSIDLTEKDIYRELVCPEDNRRWFKTMKNRWNFKHLRRNKHTVMPSMQEVEYMEEVRPRQNGQQRDAMVHEVLVNKRKIEEFCLSCGSTSVEVLHPLFEGSLCMTCRYNFTETLYRYDEDGYQAYCTVCCSGMEVILCGLNSCCRCYCMDCLDILVGVGTFKKLKEMDPWICYLCALEHSSGAMRPRHDWSNRVQEFFANTSGVDFEFQRVYPAIPANQRRPIRVLSLFDGIATGCLALRELGFKVEKYVASEVDEESVVISMVNHDGTITHVDDVKSITKDHIKKWGPFDLLIGGSPCNDLCTVNPSRKGLYDGTGRLFFEYYRLLNILRPKEDDPRPFFWLFENVVLMETKTKTAISRFLECNPVLIDAVKVSPAHRARYFWGNIPGMNRPIVPSKNDKVNLQDCLDAGRTAKHDKVRTITTRPKAMGSGASYTDCPVIMNGKDDNIWITEMEQIFGFPKHYTDVKSMGRLQRQRTLGKSWSVPVIKHLLAPLKDYFACD
ncbi:putative DNA methyltransferase dnmt5, partial [Triplophysa rosa]